MTSYASIGCAFFLLGVLPFFSLSLAGSDSHVALAAVSNAKHAAEARHKLLMQRLEDERLKLEKLESRQSELKGLLEKAKAESLETRLHLRRLEVGDLKKDGPYYRQTVASPITQQGHFYQQALSDEKTAEEHWEDLKQKSEALQLGILNQKRLVLEKLQRIKDFEQAEAEHWEHNPF